MCMPTTKYLRKKGKILCIMVIIVIESQSFFDILTEPWNPRDVYMYYMLVFAGLTVLFRDI